MTSCKEPTPGLFDVLNNLEDLQFQMANALNALDAIHVAMTCGAYNPAGYTDGLLEVSNHLNTLNQEVKNKLAEVRAIKRAEKTT